MSHLDSQVVCPKSLFGCVGLCFEQPRGAGFLLSLCCVEFGLLHCKLESVLRAAAFLLRVGLRLSKRLAERHIHSLLTLILCSQFHRRIARLLAIDCCLTFTLLGGPHSSLDALLGLSSGPPHSVPQCCGCLCPSCLDGFALFSVRISSQFLQLPFTSSALVRNGCLASRRHLRLVASSTLLGSISSRLLPCHLYICGSRSTCLSLLCLMIEPRAHLGIFKSRPRQLLRLLLSALRRRSNRCSQLVAVLTSHLPRSIVRGCLCLSQLSCCFGSYGRQLLSKRFLHDTALVRNGCLASRRHLRVVLFHRVVGPRHRVHSWLRIRAPLRADGLGRGCRRSSLAVVRWQTSGSKRRACRGPSLLLDTRP